MADEAAATEALLAPDGAVFRRTLGCFATGVTAVCAWVDGMATGLTVNAFTSVSLEPPLVSVCIREGSGTWRLLRRAERLGISVLAAHQAAVCRQLAGEPGARFRDVALVRGALGAVFVQDAVAWLECAVDREIPAGDHRLVLLRVSGMYADPDAPPLIVHGSRVQPLPVATSSLSRG